MVLVFGTSFLAHPHRSSDPGNDAAYPVQASAFVREHRPPGPLFNDFDWGGYLIWAVPEYPVSIDGRTNLYGNDRVLRNFHTLIGEGDWENDPDLRTAHLVILPAKKWPLVELLRRSKDWTVAYEDQAAVVFIR
jgi:hypothetical protein